MNSDAQPADPGLARASTITFCATGTTGLGHLRRVTNVARALRERRPTACLELLSNAPVEGLSDRDVALYRRIEEAPRSEMRRALGRRVGGPVVVDTAVLPGLSAVDAAVCLILRETVPARLDRFRLDRGRPWDLVILPNPAGEWDPDLAAVPARRVEPVGWIYRRPSRLSRGPRGSGCSAAARGGPRVLIASGGGGSGETAAAFRRETERVLGELRSVRREPIEVLQALGPRTTPEARISGVDRIVNPGADLHEAFAGADLVISTAGYNSVLELACTDVPVLLVPIRRTFDDQEQRARRWEARLGLAHRSADAGRSIRWAAWILAGRRRRPRVDLGPSGADVGAALIEEFLG